MTLIFVALALIVMGVIVLLAVGKLGQLDDPVRDRRAAELPTDAIAPYDVQALRFGVGVRGYRMDEVDEVLDRLAHELSDRDAKIADLSARTLRAENLASQSPASPPSPPTVV